MQPYQSNDSLLRWHLLHFFHILPNLLPGKHQTLRWAFQLHYSILHTAYFIPFAIAKLRTFACLIGIQITDSPTNIPDLEMVIDKKMNKAIILNWTKQ